MKSKIYLAILTSAVLLVGCGGGGGSDSPSTSTPPVASNPTPTPPVVAPSDIQTTVPTPTYAAGSQELAYFNAYNDFRAKAGLGLLAQNTKLDTASKNHLNYLMVNKDINFSAVDPKTGRPFFHIEDPVRSGYTGVTELDRANFAQYGGGYVGETGGYGNGKGSLVAFDNLIATVYHRAGLMYQFPRDIGLAVGTDQMQTMVINFGYVSNPQKNASNFFGTYPANNQTNVPLVAYIETPNPFPELDYSEFATKTSYPVNVVSAADTTLVTNSFTVTEQGQTAVLDGRLMTQGSDPNKYLASNYAFWIGKAPFKPNTTYNASFSGTVNGVAVTKTWSFTTRS